VTNKFCKLRVTERAGTCFLEILWPHTDACHTMLVPSTVSEGIQPLKGPIEVEVEWDDFEGTPEKD
jgi:hypothetical protein